MCRGGFILTAVKEFGFCTLNPVGVSVRDPDCAVVLSMPSGVRDASGELAPPYGWMRKVQIMIMAIWINNGTLRHSCHFISNYNASALHLSVRVRQTP